jgi:hypothetical protein
VPRILPERTVEAWATAYITRWDPGALLWAPTQNDPNHWDLSARSSTGRHFVFEYKGVEGHPEPYVPIDEDQLLAYAAYNAGFSHTLVWYLLPAWSVAVPRGQLLPRAAELRVLRAEDPRSMWHPGAPSPLPGEAAVSPGSRREKAIARGCEAFFYVVDPLTIVDHGNLVRFPGWYGPVGYRVRDVPELAKGLTLEHFMRLVGDGALGLSADSMSPAEPQPRHDVGDLRPHNATAYVVRSSHLAAES